MPGRGRGLGGGGRGGRWGRGGKGRRRLLEPVILLQLRRGPSHGYGLLEGLGEFDLGHLDPSAVYRVLREMEVAGWVSSTWDEHQSQGPPRRVYRLSDAGAAVLEQWSRDLEHSRGQIDRFLSTYRGMQEGADGRK